MNINYQKIMEISSVAKQTQIGGRREIEAQQLHNLRGLVEKVRSESPLKEQPVVDGVLSDAVLLTYMSNDVQPFIRYKMGDRIRFYTDACPCGSPFRSYRVEGRQATILHIGDVALPALAFHLEHEQASRVQLVQTGEKTFKIRAEIRTGGDATAVLEKISADVLGLLRDNGISDAVISKSQQPPSLVLVASFRKLYHSSDEDRDLLAKLIETEPAI